MLLSQFTRDPLRVYKALAKTPGKLIAKEPVRIYIPTRFAEQNLAYIGSETYIVGIFMIATEDNRYGVSLINAMIAIDPTNTATVKMDDDPYYEFYFNKGATIIRNLNLVKDNKLIYSIFDEIFTKGRAPWYLNYMDFSKLFASAKKHAGVSVGENHEVMELLTSMVARDPNNRTIYYRQIVNTKEDMEKIPPAIIPLRSVQYAATNTTNKLAGSYFRPALVSALVNPSERVERVESLLTK